MTKNIKYVLIALSFLAFIVLTQVQTERGNKENLDFEFYGKVDSVTYDIKGKPYVTIKGKMYYLSYNDWNFKYQIEQNDSLQKKSNSFIITLIKHKSGEKIEFGY